MSNAIAGGNVLTIWMIIMLSPSPWILYQLHFLQINTICVAFLSIT